MMTVRPPSMMLGFPSILALREILLPVSCGWWIYISKDVQAGYLALISRSRRQRIDIVPKSNHSARTKVDSLKVFCHDGRKETDIKTKQTYRLNVL